MFSGGGAREANDGVLAGAVGDDSRGTFLCGDAGGVDLVFDFWSATETIRPLDSSRVCDTERKKKRAKVAITHNTRARLHHPQLGTHTIKHARRVDIHVERVFFVRHVDDADVVLEDAREVRRAVEPAVLGDDRGDPRVDGLAVADVDDGSGVFALTITAGREGFQRLVQPGEVHVGKADGGAS